MRCLVTGAAGFIGSHLSEALTIEGHEVLGVDCFTDYYSEKLKLANLSQLRRLDGFKLVEVDLSDANLSQLLEGVDTVFHLAAQPGVRASWGTSFSHYVKDNIVATQRLLEAMKGASAARFVYASSSSIYGDSERQPTPEDTTPSPVSPYGMTKLAAEHLCRVYFRSYGVPVVVLRYFTVYGPRQRPDMAFNRFIAKIASGDEIEVYGDGEQRRDFTYVGDTVAGTILAAKGDAGAVYNIGAGRSTALNEVISILESLIGKRARIRRLETAAGDVKTTMADIGRVRDKLGYDPRTSLIEGLKRQVSYQLQ